MNAIEKLWRGQYSLPITYWGFGVLGTLVLRAATWLLPPTITNAIAAVVALCFYLIVVQVGVWRAASAHKGPVVWAWLAKVIAALSVLNSRSSTLWHLKGADSHCTAKCSHVRGLSGLTAA